MNAAIAIDRRGIAETPVEEASDLAQEAGTEEPLGVEAEVEGTDPTPPSFGAVQAVSVPLAVIAIFVLTTVSMTAYRGDVVGAMGVAVYLAIWIGLGFGFIFGGAYWAMRQPHP